MHSVKKRAGMEFHDAEAEDVLEKAREEPCEESERVDMSFHDDRRDLLAVEDQAPPGVSFADAEKMEHVESRDEVQPASDPGGASSADAGNAAPSNPIFPELVGPLDLAHVPQTPRAAPTTRAHGDDEDSDIDEHQAERLKNEDPKGARLQRIAEEYTACANAVQFGDDKFHTIDSYGVDQDLEQPDDPIDLWADEESLHIKDVPEDLCSLMNHLSGLRCLPMKWKFHVCWQWNF